MADKEELGKLSPEQLQRLGSVLSEAKNITYQQEEVVNKVLTGEKDIGELRISYLDQYFDKYSKGLDLIARKYSNLNDAFLILDRQLGNDFEKLSSEIADLSKKVSKANWSIQSPSDNIEPNENKNKSTNSETVTANSGISKELVVALRDLTKVLYKSGSIGQNANLIEELAATRTPRESFVTDGGGRDSGGGVSKEAEVSPVATPPAPPVVTAPESTISTEPAKQKRIDTVTVEVREQLNEISLKTVEDLRRAYVKRIQQLEQDAVESQLALEFARSKTEEDIQNRSTEFRLSKIKEVTDAEIASQKLLNEFNTQLAYASTSGGAAELGEMRARQVEAEGQAKALEALKTEMASVRAQKELDAMLRANDVLQEADYARIEQEIAEEYNLRVAQLQKLATEQSKFENLKQSDPKLAAALEAKKAQYVADQEYKARLKNNGRLDEDERRRIQQRADEEFKLDKKNLDKLAAEQQRQENKDRTTKHRSATEAAVTTPLSADNSLKDRFKALVDVAKEENVEGNLKSGIVAGLDVAVKALSTLVQQLDTTIDKVASYKGDIDTRLQGSNNKQFMGSYWGQLTRDMMSVGAVTPFFRQEDFANNIKALVERGISFDLKQRAFLMTIQEKIANTFNVADGTLLRLIRIQQEDTTAGRLGMESALNSFLNEMYETSEYLTDVAASVRSSLEEMEALMSGAVATEVEYQVQKWMGSLYSVGMSQGAVQSIATALGQIASGQIEALTNGGTGNLLVMAANNSGKSIADILEKGLNADETNELLQSTVNYLAEIAEASKGNNVVQQQLANVFGIKASDLRAATNLQVSKDSNKSSVGDIFNEYMTYNNMLKQLNNMAGSMYLRTSLGEMMTNIWENGQYTIASSMANNPVAYLLYKVAGLLEETTGGISLPFLNVMGFGVDLETTVADLIRVASVSTGVLGSLGPILSGLASSFSGQAMLKTMGISGGSGIAVTPRGGDGVGGGGNEGGGAASTSGSGYVGSSSSSDIKDSTVQESEDSKKQQMIEAKEEEPANQVDMLNTYVLKMYELLEAVSNGDKSFTVKVAGYGLTGISTGSSDQGGVSGLTGGSSSDSGNAIDLGGWTMR